MVGGHDKLALTHQKAHRLIKLSVIWEYHTHGQTHNEQTKLNAVLHSEDFFFLILVYVFVF